MFSENYEMRMRSDEPFHNLPAWNLGTCMVHAVATAYYAVRGGHNPPLEGGQFVCMKHGVDLVITNAAHPPITTLELVVIIRALNSYQHVYQMTNLEFELWERTEMKATGSVRIVTGHDRGGNSSVAA